MRLIDADALKRDWRLGDVCENCQQDARRCQYNYDYTLMDICEMLDDAPTVAGWISVDEAMPKPFETVLICEEDTGAVYIAIWEDHGGPHKYWIAPNIPFRIEPSHWMKIPDRPEEVTDHV